jgi:hypothetical protein
MDSARMLIKVDLCNTLLRGGISLDMGFQSQLWLLLGTGYSG